MSNKQIIKKEIRFAVHIPAIDGVREDYHYVKEQITYDDGSIEPKTYLVKEFKRPIWITKPAFRNHKEKKEFEDLDKVTRIETTESDITKTIAKYLNLPHLIKKPELIKESPYIYGTDITSTSFIKYTSLKRNDFVISPYTICTFDIETTPYTKELLVITIAMKNKTYTAVLKSFIKNVPNIKKEFIEKRNLYLEKYKDITSELEVFDNELDIIKAVFKKLNEWMPDFLVIWNMDYDIPFILSKLEEYNVKPEYVLCDSKLPLKLRVAKYKQGIKKKVTASGVVKPINPSLQWHSLILTAPFYVIDAMCVYRQLRMAQQEEPSYSLDAILQKELGVRKLKFDVADSYKGINWHLFMQEKYPVEYLIYNLYDCLSLIELDDKIKDISITLPTFSGITDFMKFNSNPKKITDALFLFGLEKNKIIGVGYKAKTKNEDNSNEEDEVDIEDNEDDSDEEDVSKYKTLSLKNWIQMLPQHLLVKDGLKCIEEYPNLITNIRGLVYDADVSSSYPSVTNCCNVSKETTYREVITVEGISEEKFRLANLSIPIGQANILYYFSEMFNMPKLSEL